LFVLIKSAEMKKRLVGAMIAYALLIGLAVYLLRGKLLYAVLLLFALLVTRTLIAAKAGWVLRQDPPPSNSERPFQSGVSD
jgi:hypothetical protein